MKKENYFIIGMPSSGKSTIGKYLAGELGLIFIDLDEVIVKAEGTSITEIFQRKGESYFRTVERKNLTEQIDKNDGFVMATGGGAPCFFDNLELMKQKGVTIFLDISLKELHAKLSKKGTHKRPLLKGFSDDALYIELREKLSDRRKFYEQADIRLSQRFNNISDRVNEIIEALHQSEE